MRRRDFLASGATLTLGALAFGTSERSLAQPPPSIRKSINGLTGADQIVKSYAKAVDVMKKLQPHDPRNWVQQANIHNNFCPHGNWWFLPWHRAYLFYFEDICRDVLQDPAFSLPYWDWTALPHIPDPFLDAQSPLWDNGRRDNGNIQLGTEIVGPKVVSQLLGSGALVDLFSSPTTTDDQRQDIGSGTLEGTPHNGVHSSILGNMGTFLSPLDPIFWLHHCNVDRIWASWARETNNLAPTANLWRNHALRVFYDPKNKQQVSPNAGDTLDASKYRSIYDKYETRGLASFVPLEESLRSALLGPGRVVSDVANVRSIEMNRLTGGEITLGTARQFELAVPHNFARLLQRAVFSPPPGASAVRSATTYLQIEKIPQPSVPSTALRIFLNCKHPSLDTSLDDATYVGTVAFFGGTAGPAHHSDKTFTVNVTTTLSKVVQTGIYSAGNPIDVALLPVDLSSPNRTSATEVLRPGSIRLVGVEMM